MQVFGCNCLSSSSSSSSSSLFLSFALDSREKFTFDLQSGHVECTLASVKHQLTDVPSYVAVAYTNYNKRRLAQDLNPTLVVVFNDSSLARSPAR